MNDGTPITLGHSFWAIDPLALPGIIEARWHRSTLAEFAARIQQPIVANHKPTDRPGGQVAVIPLTGVLTPRPSLLSLLFGGGGGLEEFRTNFRAAMADPDVGSIVFDVDSPGGVVTGIPEMADEVAEARGQKPMTAVVNNMMASAAYWIGSQADEVVVTPSGSVGSIGVYMVHTDSSAANEKDGVKPTYISSGKYKVEGNPDQPLSREAQQDWQAESDHLYGMFVDSVAEARGTTAQEVRDGYGQGRTARGSRALEMGLADRVDTLENVVASSLLNGSTGQRSTEPTVVSNYFGPTWSFSSLQALAKSLSAAAEDDDDDQLSDDNSSGETVFPELEFAD